MRWNSEKLFNYFDRNFYGLKRSSNNWYMCQCPDCGSEKLAVSFKYFQVKCWKGCHPKQHISDFVSNHLGVDYQEAREIVNSEDVVALRVPKLITRRTVSEGIVLPEGFTPILDGTDTVIGRRAFNYLNNRGFDMNYLDMLGIGYCNEGGYMGFIIIPFRKFGKLVYFIARDFMDRGDKFRYKNPKVEQYGVGKSDVIFNSDALHLYEKVYMTEGWGDAVSTGKSGISVQGLDLSLKQFSEIVKSPVKEIVIIPDAGAYKEALKNARKLIKHKKVRIMNLDIYKEQGLGKDVNAIGWDILRDTQYDYPILTNHKWFQLMRKA